MSSQKKKEKVKEKNYNVKMLTKEGEFEYISKWIDLRKNLSENCRQIPEKRKLRGPYDTNRDYVPKKKYCINKSSNAVWNIKSLPEEIVLEIFRYLSHMELCRIARVCKRWHELTRCPLLWKNVTVQFQEFQFPNKMALKFAGNLPTCVTQLKLDFNYHHLQFEKFCLILEEKCPSLKAFILHNTCLSVSFKSAIDLCGKYMQNLEVLSFRYTEFGDYSLKVDYSDFSKLKVLDFHINSGIPKFSKSTFSKMPNLKKLSLVHENVNDTLFKGDAYFLRNLEMLNLQWTWAIGSRSFQALQKHALKLTELYLCSTKISDGDFSLHVPVFPQLETVCLRRCPRVTSEGIVLLIRSCHSLKNVFVYRSLAESFVVHPFAIANKCKLQIVKTIDECSHYKNVDYLYDE